MIALGRHPGGRMGEPEKGADVDDRSRLIEILRGALADIAFSDDMTLEVARRKARRIYKDTAHLTAAAPLEGWRPISEARMYESVVVTDGERVGTGFRTEGGFYVNEPGWLGTPTHCRALPLPPNSVCKTNDSAGNQAEDKETMG